jgi:pyruvate dehydrogenase E2 component (dihydrolipoamide acetyltransferase)
MRFRLWQKQAPAVVTVESAVTRTLYGDPRLRDFDAPRIHVSVDDHEVTDFRMPSLGADMEAGMLVQWLKRPGDRVTRGDIIAVVDTQKGAIDIEVFEDGVLDRILVNPGTQVPVGTVLAVIRGAGEITPLAAPTTVPVPGPTMGERRRISPAARKLAETLGVDLARVKGTGTDGAITRDDIERGAAPKLAAAAAPADRGAGMRQAIAAAMARAKREIPHVYLAESIDLSAALRWVATVNDQRPLPERLLPAVLLLKASALALRGVPDLNGFWIDGAFTPGRGIHVGWAISLRGGGLVAPALHEADTKPLDTLMRELRDLVGRARSGSLRSSELADPTFTVTNLGEQGVESAYGIIYPPQVGLLAFGKVTNRPWVVDGRIEARPLVTATLSADHRAVDGHRGGLFLAAVSRLLQEPEKL